MRPFEWSRLLERRRALGVRLGAARWPRRCQSTIAARKWSTPLAESLAKAITTTGPIPVASFMRQCLTAPDVGYYTQMNTSGRDPFGQTGDFITAPEISQVFGELVGLWVIAEWMAQGRQQTGVQLVELGPGRGTLMADMLRTMQSFRPFMDSLDTIYLLEASPMLRDKQHRLLCDSEPLRDVENGHESRIKYGSKNRIVWYEDMRFLPPTEQGQSPFVIAHEFFDALPIHVFQSIQQPPKTRSVITSTTAPPRSSPVQNEWRELVVSVAAPDPQAILSPASAAKDAPEFELSVSKMPTPHSTSLPTLSERYKALLPVTNSSIEISPLSLTLTSQIASQIGGPDAHTTNTSKTPRTPSTSSSSSSAPQLKHTPSGAALIIDYGTPTTIPTHSLRGIRAHTLVPPLSRPGTIDLSASVDFTALAHAALAGSARVEVHGPARQADWLRAMGGAERVGALVARARARAGSKTRDGDRTMQKVEEEEEEEDKVVERIEGAWKRLVDTGPKGMGALYHVMAIVPEGRMKQGGVVGFGGDIIS